MPDQADRLRQLAAERRPIPLSLSGRGQGDAGAVAGPPEAATRVLKVNFDRLETRRRARTIAVTSGKGGVGKSCLALNLGVVLAGLGHRVAVVDLDLGLANIDVLADLRTRHNLYHVLVGQKSLGEIAVPGPGGILVVPGASGINQLADLADSRRRDLIARLAELEERADYLLIDTAAGIARNVIGFVQAADEVLVVTTPEPTAITDAYAVIKTICRQEEHGDLNLVVNQCANRVEAERVARRIALVARQFLNVFVTEAGYVVSDPAVKEAVHARRPFALAFPDAPATAGVHAIARAFSRVPVPATRPQGFFGRLLASLCGR